MTGLACMCYMPAKAESIAQHYDAYEVQPNGVPRTAVEWRVVEDSARIIEAKTGKTRMLLGGIRITADNSLPPCIE